MAGPLASPQQLGDAAGRDGCGWPGGFQDQPTLEAVLAGMIEPLTDEPDIKAALLDVARAVIG